MAEYVSDLDEAEVRLFYRVSSAHSRKVITLGLHSREVGALPSVRIMDRWCNWSTRRSHKADILGSNPRRSIVLP